MRSERSKEQMNLVAEGKYIESDLLWWPLSLRSEVLLRRCSYETGPEGGSEGLRSCSEGRKSGGGSQRKGSMRSKRRTSVHRE